MPRKPNITAEQDVELQIPIANAIETYFHNVYTEDSRFGSVGTGFVDDKGDALAFIAFRVPGAMSKDIDKLLRSVAERFHATILVDDPTAHATVNDGFDDGDRMIMEAVARIEGVTREGMMNATGLQYSELIGRLSRLLSDGYLTIELAPGTRAGGEQYYLRAKH